MRIQAEELLQEIIYVDRCISTVIDEGSVRKTHTHRLNNERLANENENGKGRHFYVVEGQQVEVL
jgi:hypothetical protein